MGAFTDKCRAREAQAKAQREMKKKLREAKRKRDAEAKKNWGPKKPRKKKK